MPAKKTGKKSGAKPETVNEYFATLTPVRRQETQAVRKIILGVNPKITEEIKWNAPSFALGEPFATFNAWAKDDVQLILHHGPKKSADRESQIQDPGGLLEWLAADRARIRFDSLKDVQSKKSALQSIIKQWIESVKSPPSPAAKTPRKARGR